MTIKNIQVDVTSDPAIENNIVALHMAIELTITTNLDRFYTEVLEDYNDFNWSGLPQLNHDENEFMRMWTKQEIPEILKESLDECQSKCENQNNVFRNYFTFDVDELKEYPECVAIKEDYDIVAILMGLVVESGEELEKLFFDQFQVNIQFLETVITKPNVTSNGEIVPETGGRHDVIIAIHKEHLSKFITIKVTHPIRWLEDVLAGDISIYPSHIRGYKK